MGQCTFHALGSTILIIADAMNDVELDLVSTWFATWEQSLSRFLPTSELQVLNTAKTASVSPLLWAALHHALEVARRTAGLVTPTVLPALLAAGYTQSFDQAFMPSTSSKLVNPTAWDAIHCEPSTRTIQLPMECEIDLGGTAKGWLVDQTLARLSRSGSVLVDAGGDIGVSGPRSDGQAWPIEVSHPWPNQPPIALIALKNGGIATSGRDYRRWPTANGWSHHLIDPRTSQPATTDVLSATVIGPDAASADWAAKVVLLLGSNAGLAWLDNHPAYAGVVILDDGTALRSRRFSPYCWPTSEEQ